MSLDQSGYVYLKARHKCAQRSGGVTMIACSWTHNGCLLVEFLGFLRMGYVHISACTLILTISV